MTVGTLTVGGLDIEVSAVVLGLITGMTYGLLAVGLILVFRATRVINFAYGQIGAFGAAVMGVAVAEWGLPYWFAFAIAVLTGAAVSALVEISVIRRLRAAPIVMTIVATVGVADLLLSLGSTVNDQAGAGAVFPSPDGFPTFTVGSLTVTPASSAILILAPVVVLALAAFFRWSTYGLAIRASALNADAAELAGISTSRMAVIVWSIAGAMSAMTAVLVIPTQGFVASGAFGPSLLVAALAGAVLARMDNLPLGFIGGMLVGVLEGVLRWNYPTGGPTQAVIFLAILAALLIQPQHRTRHASTTAAARVQPWRPLPRALRELPAVRRFPIVVTAIAAVVAVAITPLLTNRAAVILTGMFAFALVGVSIVILTGLSGQVSLGQFALAAVGGVVSYKVADATGASVLALVSAGVAVAAVATVIGLPALRVRGLMLAVVTLAFAYAANDWLLRQGWMLGDGAAPGRPDIFGLDIDTSRSYYAFAVVLFIIGLVLAWNLKRSGLGRRLVAVRDNEDGARAFAIEATRVKLFGFAASGFIAGLGGAIYIHSLTFATFEAFPLSASINVLAMAAIGGIELLAGPLLGALYIVAFPAFVPLDSAALAATTLGWLTLVVMYPGGLAQAFAPMRDRVVDWLARRAGLDPVAIRARGGAGGEDEADLERAVATMPTRAPASVGEEREREPVILGVREIRKSYGGLVVLDGIDFDVARGETLGIIGPNGAGKTTLFEILTGFVSPDSGDVVFEGRSVRRWSPAARARVGLVRSFQDGGLFSTLTVEETLALAQERVDPTRPIAALAGSSKQSRAQRERARELGAFFGLATYLDHQIDELSIGTRRIVELAALTALGPELLLLDEPSSGVAERETDALGQVLADVKAYLGATLVIIEHDVPLIASLSDRLLAMGAGQVLALGEPNAVLSEPAVVESYLGAELDLTRADATNEAGDVRSWRPQVSQRATPAALDD